METWIHWLPVLATADILDRDDLFDKHINLETENSQGRGDVICQNNSHFRTKTSHPRLNIGVSEVAFKMIQLKDSNLMTSESWILLCVNMKYIYISMYL